MPIPQAFESASRAAVLAALLLVAGVSACGDAGGAEQGAEQASDFDDLGNEELARVEVDPCALLTSAEISGQLARAISPSERPDWSTLEFDITPTEVEWGISRRCEYKFQSRETTGGGPVWHSDFNVMVIHATFANAVGEHKRSPVEGAPEIFSELHTDSYYITKGDLAATLTSFPGSREGDESDEDATRIALLRRIAERLP